MALISQLIGPKDPEDNDIYPHKIEYMRTSYTSFVLSIDEKKITFSKLRRFQSNNV